MINKQIAVKLYAALNPSAVRGWDKPTINHDVAVADRVLMVNPMYAVIGDIRQAPVCVLKMEGEDELVEEILTTMIAQHEEKAYDPAVIGKLITGSKWGKRKANKEIAKAMACSMVNNKPCSGAGGCGCNN